jgi:hypothetical protein
MGILVPEASIPMGISLSNVYMSFTSENIYVCSGSGKYNINSYYKIFKDQTKIPDTNIRIPISVTIDDIKDRDVYSILYSELKTIYSGSQDIIEYKYPCGMTEQEYTRGQNLMKTVSEYISQHLGSSNIEALENAYQNVENNFIITGPATNELNTLETLYNNFI